MSTDLTSLETIRSIHENEFLPRVESDESWKQWLPKYVALIEKVRNASEEELATREFQTILWEGDDITGQGMCTVSMEDAIASDELSRWIAALRFRDLPEKGSLRVDALQKIHDELYDRVLPLTSRRPWLKLTRLMAALFPEDVCCLVVKNQCRRVASALVDKLTRDQSRELAMHSLVYERMEAALGPRGGNAESVAKRSMFAWSLFAWLTNQAEEASALKAKDRGESELLFLPQEERKNGIISIGGYFRTILSILRYLEDGANRTETISFIQQENPNLNQTSAAQALGVLRIDLGLVTKHGDEWQLSELGRQVLETEDATLLIPRVLTRVIGYDLLLFVLGERGQASRGELVSELQTHYANWTSDFVPASILGWSFNLGLIDFDEERKVYRLTDVGREYAGLITTRPETIKVSVEIDGGQNGEGKKAAATQDFHPPTLGEILERFDKSSFVFPRELIAQLHLALHAQQRKHFVLLSGLSGTGKTQLAKLYADAYHRIDDGKNPYFRLVPVQPDWTDPTGLLGYVNPLQETVTYATTRFLSFLQSAVRRPDRPHFVCLDEMNLARVEYYFAPFLSAMETGSPLVVHQEKETVDTVEPTLKWPENLFVIGTVNMDETTYAFSDKVLDRAFTLEFWDVDLDEFGRRFGRERPDYDSDLLAFGLGELAELKRILEPAHMHFGYRTAGEVLDFLGANHQSGAGVLTREDALDRVVLMKILPKLRGQDSQELRGCLARLAEHLNGRSLPLSARKVEVMAGELERTGTTRFWR